jgi:TonB-linked SusC/RagA family outer membrane protein
MKKLFLLIVLFVFVSGFTLLAQTITITGTVNSAVAGEGPIPGVTVVAKGTTIGSVTDVNGKYSITVPTNVTTLVFTYIGMKPQEVLIEGRKVIDATLQSELVGLNEVVVTALGIKRSEKSIGYSTSTVNSTEITSAKSSSLITGLQGKVAGLSISTAGGTGTSQKVYIRGISSFTGSNQPLYIVNGVPMSNSFAGNSGTNNSVDFGNQANDINPDDVESVTVLKGASATALYGSRAANGVIMITTKRGAKDGKISVVYNGSVTGSNILRVPQTQKNFGEGWPYWDPAENGSWGPKLDGRMNVWGAYSTPDYGSGSIPALYAGYEVMKKPYSYVENQMRDFYETGMEYQNDISISGGDANNSFAMSYGNTYSDGVVPTNADLYKRNIFSFRGDHKSGKFNSSFDISYVRKDIKAVSSGQGSDGAALFQELAQMPVDIPISTMSDYNSMYYNFDNFFTLYAENPYYVVAKNGNTYQDDRVYGKIELGYDVLKNTKLLARVGGDFTNARQRSFNAVAKVNADTWNSGVKSDEPGTYDEFNSYNGQIDASGLISGDYKLFSDFRLNAVAGINWNTRNAYSSDAYVFGLAVPDWYSLSNGFDKPATTSSKSQRTLFGALGQFDLSFKEWAFFTLSMRNDWSSTLPVNKNSYFYAGVNGAVLLTEAIPSLKDGKILDYAKIRLAWGQTGNDAPLYRTYGNYIPSLIGLGFGSINMPIGGIPGITLSNLQGNLDLKPEITTDTEVGADLKFFGNRLGIDVAYYMKSTKDQIISSSVAPETKFTSYTRNVGQVDNKGIEARLSLVPVRTSDFEWEIITTYSKNRSKVVKLWDDVKEYRFTGAYGVDFVAIVGQPLGVFKVPQAALSPDGKIIVDATGRPTIDPLNKKIVGSRESDFVLGFNNRFTFKGITLSAVLDYRKGGKFWSNTAELLAFDGNSPITVFNERQAFLVPNSVRKVGTAYVENDIPILGTAMYSYYNHSTNTLMYENMVLDKTFMKLRELTLSYAFPKNILANTPVKGLEVSIVGRNLLMWTPKTNNFVDPEATNYGNDLLSDFGEFSAGPSSRFFGGNLKVTF